MRKISFRVRNFDKEKFLTFDIDNGSNLDEELFAFLEEEEPECIVPVIYEEGEEFDTFSYDITDKIQLRELSNQEINEEIVLMVLQKLVLTLIDMEEYEIPLSYLVLHRNYIYVDSEYNIEFICIPLEDMRQEVELSGFFRNLLAGLRFDSSENGDYVAKLFTYINNPKRFNLQSMLFLIEELMEEEDDEIPEEDTNPSVLEQTHSEGKNTESDFVPKANPYLIRVNTKERVMIAKQNFKIGKASVGVDYTVTGNGAVSRVHAIITNKNGNYYIKDNKSMNHTYLNGNMVREGEKELLTDESRIVLGDEEFVFKIS